MALNYPNKGAKYRSSILGLLRPQAYEQKKKKNLEAPRHPCWPFRGAAQRFTAAACMITLLIDALTLRLFIVPTRALRQSMVPFFGSTIDGSVQCSISHFQISFRTAPCRLLGTRVSRTCVHTLDRRAKAIRAASLNTQRQRFKFSFTIRMKKSHGNGEN